jgi:hypothetical protein
MKTIDQQRAEFEEWMERLENPFYSPLTRIVSSFREYQDLRTEAAWLAWKEQERRFAELVKTKAAMKRLLAHAISCGCEFETDGDEALDAVLDAMAAEGTK